MRSHSAKSRHVVSVEVEMPRGTYVTTKFDSAGKTIVIWEGSSSESIEEAEDIIVEGVGRIIAAVKA